MRKLQCTSCGGVIDQSTMRCNMCGMQYMLDSDGRIEIVNTNRPIILIHEGVTIPADYIFDPEIGAEVMARKTISELTERLAKRILPLVEFQTMYMGMTNSYKTSVRIGVAEPKKEFTIKYGDQRDILGYGDPPDGIPFTHFGRFRPC